MPSATDTGASDASTKPARTIHGSPSVASSSGSNPASIAKHHSTTSPVESGMPAGPTRSATRLPSPENTSIPVSTRANALARSLR